MCEILFLHGFFQTDPETTPLLKCVRRHLPKTTIHAPPYHPDGNVRGTRIDCSLELCRSIIRNAPEKRVNIIGFSFGGLLGALLAEREPELTNKLLLFAPAIDNFERNYAPVSEDAWIMPRSFVDELLTYPARPRITRPTSLVHGTLDTDQGGCSPWRIERWAQESTFDHIHILNGVDHSLEPWLSRQTPPQPIPATPTPHLRDPSLRELVEWLQA